MFGFFEKLKLGETNRKLAEVFRKFEIGAMVESGMTSRLLSVWRSGKNYFREHRQYHLAFSKIGTITVDEKNFFLMLKRLEERIQKEDSFFSLAEKIAAVDTTDPGV